MNKSGNTNMVLIVLLAFILIVGIFIFAVPLPYTATEVYTTQEPYTDTESYTVKEPYQIKICKNTLPNNVGDLVVGGITGMITGEDPFIECNMETRYKDATKFRTVTKYKPVRKERRVTEYATLFMRFTE